MEGEVGILEFQPGKKYPLSRSGATLAVFARSPKIFVTLAWSFCLTEHQTPQQVVLPL
jgi:hypothetical protein